jgi:hypothetical protein
LDAKGYIVSFFDGQVIICPRGKNFDDVVVNGFQEGGIYKLKWKSDSTLVHETVNPSELWHRIFPHLNYKALLSVRNMVMELPNIQENPDGMCKGCT